MKYFIYKFCRMPDAPYIGPTCIMAGIEPGKWYSSREEAEIDAKILSDFNPVGFSVQEVNN